MYWIMFPFTFDGMVLQLRGENLVSEDPEADDVGAGWHGILIVNSFLGVDHGVTSGIGIRIEVRPLTHTNCYVAGHAT